MSHQSQRQEKDCLNCGATVAGRYCQNCGQENIVPKQSVWGLVTHFVYDIFHFDGKFFHTLKYLLTRPGFIPKEYIAGKRMRYLDPIRMYLFTSAVFFLIFFSLGKTGGMVNLDESRRLMTKLERLEYSSLLHQRVKSGQNDSAVQKQLDFLLDSSYRLSLGEPGKPTNDSNFLVQVGGEEYLMTAEKIKKGQDELLIGGGRLGSSIQQKWKAYKRKFGDDEKALVNDIINSFVHKFPYILFVSLPFFALILKLLYARKKQFFYSDHAVFTLYHYIFTFILLLLYFLFVELYAWLDWGLLQLLATLTFLSGGLYLLIAMKRFYGQKWLRTLFKFVLLNILAFITIVILMVGFIIFSVFQL